MMADNPTTPASGGAQGDGITQVDIDRAMMWWMINHELPVPQNLIAAFSDHRRVALGGAQEPADDAREGVRERLQAAWDSWPFGLPPIDFTDAEAEHLAAAFLRSPAESGDEPVMIPREPTEAMMDAGLYHSGHDADWADVHTMWKAMFDAVTLDGGCTTEAPAESGGAQATAADVEALRSASEVFDEDSAEFAAIQGAIVVALAASPHGGGR